jgi:hypothetical protein
MHIILIAYLQRQLKSTNLANSAFLRQLAKNHFAIALQKGLLCG